MRGAVTERQLGHSKDLLTQEWSNVLQQRVLSPQNGIASEQAVMHICSCAQESVHFILLCMMLSPQYPHQQVLLSEQAPGLSRESETQILAVTHFTAEDLQPFVIKALNV